jgi:glycosyltransferase involved in cell wall biosynthesis
MNTEQEFVVGFVGRIHPDKGLDILAEALRILSGQGLTGRCLIMGALDSAVGTQLLEDLSSSAWSTDYLGFVENVQAVLPLIDVLCLPSRREGFPNVVLEAAALGIACVGSDATGVVDSIVDEETGLLFRNGDADGLARQLARMMCEPGLVIDLGTAARKRALTDFPRDTVWAAQESFYSSLHSTRSRRGSRVR